MIACAVFSLAGIHAIGQAVRLPRGEGDIMACLGMLAIVMAGLCGAHYFVTL